MAQSRTYKGISTTKLEHKFRTDAEYVAKLVSVNHVVVNVQQCSLLLTGYAIPA